MRLVVGSALVVGASSSLSVGPPMNFTVPGVLLMGAGILLLVGLWTPVAGTSIAVTEIWNIVMVPGDKGLWLLLGTVGAGVAMLGPGLWSVDARLYGWKRLEATPHKKFYKNSPND
jgi:putative oxidoreductase